MWRLAASAALVTAACAFVGSAGAVVYGAPDGATHPHVGLVRFWDGSGRYLQRCSGTMLSPRVLLTAAHCTAGAATARVWLTPTAPTLADVTAGEGDAGHVGTPHSHPRWQGLFTPSTYDVGVVVLEQPIAGPTVFGQLPAVGAFDDLARARGQQEQLVSLVGYGLQGTKPEYVELVERFAGTARIITANSLPTDGYNFRLSSSPAAPHSGGICLGDSGGPAFHGTSNVIVGVASFVKKDDCRGGGFVHRVDLADENGWIRGFLQ